MRVDPAVILCVLCGTFQGGCVVACDKDDTHKEAKALLQKVKRGIQIQAKKDAKVFGGMFSKLGGLYKDSPKPEVKKDEGGEIKEPIDIGGGFSMEEIKDGAEANAAMDNV